MTYVWMRHFEEIQKYYAEAALGTISCMIEISGSLALFIDKAISNAM